MKNFIIGLIVGFLIGGTSVYGIVVNKVKKVATKENIEKVDDATKSLIDSIVSIF